MRKYESYIVGYYGMQNTGDDALLAATIQGVKTYLGHKHVLVSSNAQHVAFDNSVAVSPLKATPRFPGQNRLIHYRNALQSEQIVFGGGSVLHSARDLDLKRHLIALSGAKKGVALGVGIEAFKTVTDEKACVRFLNACDLVATRDKASYQIAKAIAPSANVIQSFDLAPMIAANAPILSTSERKGIAINLCPLFVDAMGSRDYVAEEKLIQEVSSAVQLLWNTTKQEVTLISFNGHKHQTDDALLQRLKDAIGETVPVHFVAYNANPFLTLSLMRRFKVVLGMRLHCNVFAYLANTPCISLNYHPKSEAWCQQIGAPARYQVNAFLCTATSIFDAVTSVVSYNEKTASMPVEVAVKKAQSNWEFAL